MILLELCASLLALCAVQSTGASEKSLPSPAHLFSHGRVLETNVPVSDDGSVGPIQVSSS